MSTTLRRVVLPALLAAGLGVVVLYPLVVVLSQAFTGEGGGISLDSFAALFQSPVFAGIVWTSIEISLIATSIAVVVGGFLGAVLGLMPFPGSMLITRTINLYLSLPSFLIVLAFIYLWGGNGVFDGISARLTGRPLPFSLLSSQWGVILAEVIFYTPFIVEPVLAAAARFDWSQLEIARLLGAGPLRLFRTIVLPDLMPALLAGGSLVLMHTLNEFGIVIFTGSKNVVTLPTLVYSQAIGTGNLNSAAAIAIVNSLLSVALFVLSRALVRRAGMGRTR